MHPCSGGVNWHGSPRHHEAATGCAEGHLKNKVHMRAHNIPYQARSHHPHVSTATKTRIRQQLGSAKDTNQRRTIIDFTCAPIQLNVANQLNRLHSSDSKELRLQTPHTGGGPAGSALDSPTALTIGWPSCGEEVYVVSRYPPCGQFHALRSTYVPPDSQSGARSGARSGPGCCVHRLSRRHVAPGEISSLEPSRGISAARG